MHVCNVLSGVYSKPSHHGARAVGATPGQQTFIASIAAQAMNTSSVIYTHIQPANQCY